MKFLTYQEFLFESKIDAIRQEIPYDSFHFDPKTREYDPKRRVSGKSKIIDFAGRKIVLFDVNGVNIPFYLSTGSGGKKDVQPGKWYPFFGIDNDGWINKSSGPEINRYYDVPLLKKLASALDSQIGDVREDPKIPKVLKDGKHKEAINRGFQPAENERPDSIEKLKLNIDNFKKRLEKIL
jgi:hypothetical protein